MAAASVRSFELVVVLEREATRPPPHARGQRSSMVASVAHPQGASVVADSKADASSSVLSSPWFWVIRSVAVLGSGVAATYFLTRDPGERSAYPGTAGFTLSAP
jgi:hypothetical protein